MKTELIALCAFLAGKFYASTTTRAYFYPTDSILNSSLLTCDVITDLCVTNEYSSIFSSKSLPTNFVFSYLPFGKIVNYVSERFRQIFFPSWTFSSTITIMVTLLISNSVKPSDLSINLTFSLPVICISSLLRLLIHSSSSPFPPKKGKNPG